jgi:hypothetical protein
MFRARDFFRALLDFMLNCLIWSSLFLLGWLLKVCDG